MTRKPEISFEEYQVVLRNDLATFIERSFSELNPAEQFLPSQYIELLAASLERCRTGKTRRLIINLPPRTLKSHAASVAFPAWILGHDPTRQIICASYGQSLAEKHARDCRTLMSSAFYRGLFPKASLSTDKTSTSEFTTRERGFRMATSVGGTLTGRGADLIILDDVLKPEEALSETLRTAANDWYFNTLLSRLNSKGNGVIVIVMQRLHQQDLVGEVLEREPWEVLSLPAIAREDEVIAYESVFGTHRFRRKTGDALHPERDSVDTYRRIRETVGEYNFQSQYQQSPVPLEGGLIKRDWIQSYERQDLPETFTFVLQSWDTASKSAEMNDFSVCTTWGFYDQRFYLLDVYRNRNSFPELKRAVLEQWQRWQPNTVLIEDKSSGIALIQELQAEGAFRVEAYKPPPQSDKFMRLAAQSVKFEAGKVLLPTRAPWLDEYVTELTGFPGTKFDDQVDSTAQALEYLGGSMQELFVWERLGRA